MSKRRRKIWSVARFQPATSCFRTAVTSATCIIQDTNDSADLNSARHGQFQEKEKTRRRIISYLWPTLKTTKANCTKHFQHLGKQSRKINYWLGFLRSVKEWWWAKRALKYRSYLFLYQNYDIFTFFTTYIENFSLVRILSTSTLKTDVVGETAKNREEITEFIQRSKNLLFRKC